ncbi:amidohydrolase family protein [Cyclobacterium qasimii]|nr:amidohydrolase family protein [Cyclobacterium qasimii]
MDSFKILCVITVLLSACQNTGDKTSVSDEERMADRYDGPIIDMHIHAVDDRSAQIGMEYNNPQTGQQFLGSKSPKEHINETLAKFKEHNIVKAVVSPEFSIEKGSPTEEWYNYAPETVLMGVPWTELVSLDTLRQKYAEGKLHVLAEMAPMYNGILPTDERVTPYFDLAEELDLPVGYHLLPGGPPGAAYTFAPKLRAAQAKPLQFEEILVSHPKMKIYIIHAGWPYLEDMKALMYAHPQVYVDIGVIDWLLPRQEFHNYLKGLVDAGFGNRIMYGSDQMIWVDAIDDAIESINSAEFLTMEQKAGIFYNNAARFLGLSEDEIMKHHEIAAHNNR